MEKKIDVIEHPTTQLFVAGKRSAFRNLSEWISELENNSAESIDFARIEAFEAYLPEERFIIPENIQETHFEVGIHLLQNDDEDFVQRKFIDYAKSLDITVYSDLTFTAGSLWFLPVQGNISAIKKLAQFTFVRVIRPVPKLRGLAAFKKNIRYRNTVYTPRRSPAIK